LGPLAIKVGHLLVWAKDSQLTGCGFESHHILKGMPAMLDIKFIGKEKKL
jgi:hypothetical protein